MNLDQMAEEKEFIKRQERALKRWKKLIAGLRIRSRLEAAYGNGTVDVTILTEKQSQVSFVLPFVRVGLMSWSSYEWKLINPSLWNRLPNVVILPLLLLPKGRSDQRRVVPSV